MTPFTSNHSKNEKARTCLLMRSHHCSRSRKSEAKRPLCSPSLKKKMRYNRFYKAAFEPRAQKTGRPSPRESNPGINFPLRGTPQVLAKHDSPNRSSGHYSRACESEQAAALYAIQCIVDDAGVGPDIK